MCEEFHCTPLEALEQPYDLAMAIIEMRSYARAKEIVESAKSQADVPQHPMVDMVAEFVAEDMRDAAAARKDKRQGQRKRLEPPAAEAPAGVPRAAAGRPDDGRR